MKAIFPVLFYALVLTLLSGCNNKKDTISSPKTLKFENSAMIPVEDIRKAQADDIVQDTFLVRENGSLYLVKGSRSRSCYNYTYLLSDTIPFTGDLVISKQVGVIVPIKF